MSVPSRASDAGPESQPESFDPLECVSLAGEYLDLYRKAKREALVNTPRNRWLCHLRAAMELLDRAEDLEIGAIEPPSQKDDEDAESRLDREAQAATEAIFEAIAAHQRVRGEIA